MKFTIFCPSLDSGGAEVVSINLCNELHKLSHEVTFICINSNGILRDDLNSNINLISLDSKRSRFAIFKLYLYLLKNQPDFLISTLREANIVSTIVFRFPFIKTNLIIREAGLIDLTRYRYLYRFFYSHIIKIFYRKNYKYIFNSRGTLESFKELNIISSNHRVTVIGNPVTDANLFTKANEQLDHKWYDDDFFVIVSVGRLHPVKDHLTLLKSFKLVSDNYPQVKLLIIGDGPERTNLMNYIDKNNLDNSVELLGYVSNPIKYIKKANLFVLTSKSEGFGNVIVESLACEKWIIATDCKGGVRDLLNNGEFGSLCKIESEYEIADKIIDFIEGRIIYSKKNQKKRALNFMKKNITEEYYNFITCMYEN